jgi:large subunit ribosomal protein L24
MEKVHVKKGDIVQVMVGPKDGDKAVRGKRGKVLVVNPADNTVVVDGLNIVKKHRKPRRANETGGIVERPRAINASNVLLYCEECKTGVRYSVEEVDGKKVRLCKKCAKAGKRTVLEYRESTKAEKKAVRRSARKETK